jgi:AAA ATPase domain
MRAATGGRARAGGGTPLIGRATEVGRLRALVARVAGGDAGALVLSGLPGVGKTRLAHEVLRIAEAAGFGTFAGRCDTVSRDGATRSAATVRTRRSCRPSAG